MKIDVETISPVKKRVAIEVPWESIKEELDLAYKGLGRRARVKGFRAGKVPRKVLEQFYREAVEGEVLQRVVDESFRKAVQEKDLFPINAPVLDAAVQLKTDEPLKFAATVEVKPEVSAENYKGLEIVRQVREVTDAEVDRELNQLREKAVVIEALSGRDTVEKADLAVIDFFGYVGDETFKGGKGINYTVEVGAGQMIPGFEDQLIGMKIGDHREFELTFPAEQGPEEVRGKQVLWKVDLKEIKQKILPELDDEFAKDLGEYESLDELKTKVRENLRTREDARTKRQLRQKALEQLVTQHQIEVPDVMVERQLDFLLEDVAKIARNNKDQAFVEALQRLREQNRDDARKQVAGMLLLEAISRQESIEVGEADVDARIEEIARENRMSAKQVRAQLQKEGRIDTIRYELKQERALSLLVEHATVKDEVVTGEVADDEHDHDHHDHDHDHDHHHDHDHDHHGHDHDHHHHGH